MKISKSTLTYMFLVFSNRKKNISFLEKKVAKKSLFNHHVKTAQLSIKLSFKPKKLIVAQKKTH